MNKEKVVVVLSGGLDSTILLYLIVNEMKKKDGKVIALTFFYDQLHKIEIEKARTSCIKLGISHKIFDISFLKEVYQGATALVSNSKVEMPSYEEVQGDGQPSTFVPNRNLILLSIATAFAESIGATKTFTGIQHQDRYGYPDTTPEFIEALNIILNLNRKNVVKVEAPFINMTKADEIKLGIELGVPFEDTWTCYNPEYSEWFTDSTGKNIQNIYACGKCPSCGERLANFKKVGIKDPILYA